MQDGDDETALMFAAANGHFECVEALMGKGAKMTSSSKATALMMVASWGRLDCVRLLAPLEKGMKRCGWTALHCTADCYSSSACA